MLEESSFAPAEDMLPYGEEVEEGDEDNYVEGEDDVDLNSPDGISEEERNSQNDLMIELDALLAELGG